MQRTLTIKFLQYAASRTRIANSGQQRLHFLVSPITNTGLQCLALNLLETHPTPPSFHGKIVFHKTHPQ